MRKDYQAIEKMFSFVVEFIDQGTKYEKAAHITRVYTRCTEIFLEVMKDAWQRACSKKDLGSLDRRAGQFKKMWAETFDQHCDSGLYSLSYHLLDKMAENIRYLLLTAAHISILICMSSRHINELRIENEQEC